MISQESETRSDEITIGLQMAAMAKREGMAGKLPKNPPAYKPKPDPVSDAIISVMQAEGYVEGTAGPISRAVSQQLGRVVHTATVFDRLRGCLAPQVKSRNGIGRTTLWRLSEKPRVTTSERLAMAISEALA